MYRDVSMAIAGANLVSVAYSLVAGNYLLAALCLIAGVAGVLVATEIE